MHLKQVCPSCHSVELDPQDDAWHCRQCGMIFDPPMVLCPGCGSVNSPEADSCSSCGHSLTLVDQVLDRHSSPRAPAFLASARDQAPALKESELRASEARLQEFVEIDRVREEIQAAKEAERRKSDQILLGFGIALGAILIAGACILGLVLAG